MSSKKITAKNNSKISKFYLLSYNFIQIIGWCYILFKLVYFWNNSDLHSSLWDFTKYPVIFFQNAAALEIVHAFTGLVKSNPIVTTFQVLSRVIVVCCVILATPTTYAAESSGLPLALLAWSFTEIIRYSYYFANITGYIPYFLIWLRYSTFILLYPIGITGELLCFYAATKYAEIYKNAWSYVLPNKWNFTFNYHYFLIFIMLLYIPLFPQLYLHMFSQRRKALSKSADCKKVT